MAFRSEVFWAIGGFDHGFQTWGHEDEEISIKLWLFGHEAAVVPGVIIAHLFRHRHPYRVTLWDAQYNQVRMAISHFSQARLAKVIEQIKPFGYWPQLVSLALKLEAARNRAGGAADLRQTLADLAGQTRAVIGCAKVCRWNGSALSRYSSASFQSPGISPFSPALTSAVVAYSSVNAATGRSPGCSQMPTAAAAHGLANSRMICALRKVLRVCGGFQG